MSDFENKLEILYKGCITLFTINIKYLYT